MSMDIEGLVQSSSNLGIVRTGQTISYESAVRALLSLKHDIVNQTLILSQALGAEVTVHSEYPEWQYDNQSKIREFFKEFIRICMARMQTLLLYTQV